MQAFDYRHFEAASDSQNRGLSLGIMQDFDISEVRKVRKILRHLSPVHPARRACDEGRSLIDIAHCVEGMQPDVLRPLLELNLAHCKRLAGAIGNTS